MNYQTILLYIRSKIDKEIETDIEKHKEEYGEDPLNTLFK